MSMDAIQQSKEKDPFVPYNDYNEFIQQQMQKQKREKEEFIRNAEEYEAIRKEKERTSKMMDLEVAHMKFQEREEIEKKRLADLKRIRDKHQQNFAAYQQLDEHLRHRQQE